MLGPSSLRLSLSPSLSLSNSLSLSLSLSLSHTHTHTHTLSLHLPDLFLSFFLPLSLAQHPHTLSSHSFRIPCPAPDHMVARLPSAGSCSRVGALPLGVRRRVRVRRAAAPLLLRAHQPAPEVPADLQGPRRGHAGHALLARHHQ